MCGIFGAINFDNYFDLKDFNKFRLLTDIVSYRGPDDSDYKGFDYINKKESNTKFNLFLGHRRLAIIDLSSDGRQPLLSENCWIIFNGEIFNYIELKNDLRSKGVEFKTQTDTEVIIKIYKIYGPSGFDRLNGMWAFAIYDVEKNLVVLSRDRFSIKPLFFYKDANKLFFSSEIKQILPLLKKRELELERMKIYLNQGLLDFDEQTLFNDILRVKPKTNMVIDLSKNEIVESMFWNYSNQKIEGSDEQLFSKFFDLFNDSVRIRLRSDVNVGSLLSGGLDSSAITDSALKFTANNIETFSVISDETKFSEEEFIDLFVSHYKIRNKKILLNTDSLKSNIDIVIQHQDEPFNYFIPVAHYNLIKSLNENSDIVVILNGQGGDEVLLGYLRFYFFYWRKLVSEKRFFLLLKELFSSLIFRTAILQLRFNAAKRYLPKKLLSEKEFLINKTELIKVWQFDDIRDAQIKDIDYISIPFLNRYEDRNSMAFSKEIRLPFLDHRLVDFLINISPEKKMRNGWSKYILRKSLNQLPDSIRWRRDKKGFILPESNWLRSDFKKEIFDLFSDKKNILTRMNLIDPNKFLEYYKKFLSGDKKIHHTDISRIYIAEKWLQRYFN
jgi:asparagine synthase (glutamine-hydrolysing)